MPESVKDRCTKAHEYIFLLSKSAKYYFDSEAIQEPLASSSVARLSQDIETQAGSDRVPGKTNGRMKAVYTKPYTGSSTKDYAAGGAQDASETKKRIVDKILSGEISGRNKRSVWTVTTKPFKGAHFATFPPDLIEPCVLAGCPENGVVLDPFNGAGTVGVVSFKNNRNYVGVELNPEYCRITVERWAKNGNQN
jgi:DNA modification methylase